MLRYLLPPVRLRMMRKSILTLSLTRACDAKCLMCYRNSMENATSEHMDRGTFLRAIDIFKRLNKSYVIVHAMGECLLHPEFDELMRILKRNEFFVRISTNGINVNKHMDTLVNVDFLKFSIEGWDAETVRKFRGVDFERLYDNVKEFWKYSRGKINYPIMLATALYKSMTKEDLQQMVETWGPYVDQINLGIAKNPVLNNSEPFNPEAMADSNLPKQYKGQFYDEEPSRTPYCYYAIKGAVIQPNGDVLPCCNDYTNRLVMGNINKLPFEDIFFGKQAKHLRKEFYEGKIEQCGNCEKLYEFNDTILEKFAQYKDYVDKLHQKIKQKSKTNCIKI